MNIDERLARLAGRHEAFAQSVEMLNASFREQAARVDGRLDKILAVLETDAENIRGLARIAEIHERRISHLEGNDTA